MLRRRSEHMNPSWSEQFNMRPSIARMTLDLDYGDMAMMDDATKAQVAGRAEALQHRLTELLVFEIKQDGQTQFKNLSVRALYKYVIKAVTIGTTEKRTAIGHGSRQSRRHHHHHHSSKKQHTTQPDNKQDNENNNSGDSDSSSSSSSGSDDSDSSDNENNDGDNNADKEEDQDGLNSALLGSKDRKTSKDSSSSMEGKSVSFGGPEGPVPLVTAEHPPQIPGVPIAKEEEDRRNNPTNEQQQSTVSPVDDTIADDITEDAIPAPPQETHGTVTYRERLGGYLHPRDMRRLVTPFSASNEPEMIVRRHVILLNVDPLRAVILRDRLLVLVPDGADSLLVDLEKRVRGGSKEIERDIFGESTDPSPHESMADIADSQHSRQSGTSSIKGMVKGSVGMVKGSVSLLKQTLTTNPIKTLHDRGGNTLQSSLGRGNSSVASSENDSTAGVSQTDISEFREWEEMEGRDWIDLPFELQCLDAVLGSVCAILGKDAGELRTNSINAMENLLNKGSGQGEDILRHMKNSIKEMSSRVHGFIRAMNLVLDETEDMALMNLSRLLTHPERFIQPVPEEILNEESDEPELILEAHLQTAFSLTNSLGLVQGEIETTQELINQRLDTVRNRLLLANMLVSLGSVCVAFGSFIGSIFGMNVPNHLETDPDVFQQIVIGTAVGMIGLLFFFGLILWLAGTLPSLRSSF